MGKKINFMTIFFYLRALLSFLMFLNALTAAICYIHMYIYYLYKMMLL